MELLNVIDTTSAVIMLGMVAGVVEFAKALFDREWRTAVIIAAAAITGALVAWPMGINPLIGAVIGFAASGYVTIAQNVGKAL